MTEFPALRESLVAAAARRRRRRLTVRAAVPAFALAVAGAVLFLVPSSSPDQERVATPPEDALAQSFAVFRRSRTPEDALPAGAALRPGADAERSRRVAVDGASRLYAVPARIQGVPSLCLLLVRGPNSLGGCSPVSAAIRKGSTLTSGGVYALLLPDGASDVRVTLADGQVREGTVLGGTPRSSAPAIVAYTSAAGVRFVQRHQVAPLPEQSPVSPPTRCPKALGPLPADADARAVRAALLAVERLYPGAAEAQAVAARPLGTPCSDAITRRTVEVRLQLVPSDPRQRKSASLSQGRLLLGIVNGHMQVYYLVH